MSRIDFIAQYVGWTPAKTRTFLDNSPDPLIITDNLCLGEYDEFGKECLYEINNYLSNHHKTIIFTNYNIEMFPLELVNKVIFNLN